MSNRHSIKRVGDPKLNHVSLWINGRGEPEPGSTTDTVYLLLEVKRGSSGPLAWIRDQAGDPQEAADVLSEPRLVAHCCMVGDGQVQEIPVPLSQRMGPAQAEEMQQSRSPC